eukprot:gnl/TRDRNA2_/TRDRNA2_177952_c3_seq7.p1 gnl/TRDRNA2_/TRDRNA2_177952_c3~~gnl/TRDRNA2_/TRDRNA2_177952_c3_seq7.p1  ORF type:complete len:651 (+),score=246.87 gnl/TRDRNA2_/TRDRNA2_177952_c3_seq7:251-1954(+)
MKALDKALTAIEKATGSSFLQTAAADRVKQIVSRNTDMDDSDRDAVMAFLQNQDSAADSGEIIGILKTMQEEMNAAFKEMSDTEAKAIEDFEALVAEKLKEGESLQVMIEEKLVRTGELAVKITELKNELEDTQESLSEDEKMLNGLEEKCAAKKKEWAERQKLRQEELLAIADTIKILNDDDALELFKKTLPGSSLLQVKISSRDVIQTARKALKGKHDPRLSFIALALRGKSVNMGGVIKMIDEMTVTLGEEQKSDDDKKLYCEKEFDTSEDKKKELARAVSKLEKAIEENKSAIATLEEEIKALAEAIKESDKAVAEATEQRKEENEDFTANAAANAACKELIAFAKNRLNKFYNPKLYKAPPKRQLTEADRQTLAAGGTLAPTAAPGGIAGTGVTVFAQVSAHVQRKDAPAAPPPVGTYSPKGEESNGVIGMIDSLVADLKKEMSEATTTEKDAQSDYEEMMSDSATKRAEDLKSIANKSGMKAELEEDLANTKAEHMATTKELMATEQYIAQLHGECDWLIQNFDLRKQARDEEVESMTKAKAVLSGADYSFLQKSLRLRGH